MFLSACVQLRTGTDQEKNLATVERLIRRAASYGAKLVATPENTAYLGPQFHKVELAESIDGPIATRLAKLADELSIHLLVGSLAERRTSPDGSLDPQRCFNTSLLFGPNGDRLAVYRKMHLFDVDVPGGVTIRESDSRSRPATRSWWPRPRSARIGHEHLLRPALSRALPRAGRSRRRPPRRALGLHADHRQGPLARAPARPRHRDPVLGRSRPPRWGTHDDGGKRVSYGHSLIVDPWGAVAAECGEGEGLCLAEIDPERTAQVRRSIPVRDHRRL